MQIAKPSYVCRKQEVNAGEESVSLKEAIKADKLSVSGMLCAILHATRFSDTVPAIHLVMLIWLDLVDRRRHYIRLSWS